MGNPFFAANLFAPLQQLARWIARTVAGAPGCSAAPAPCRATARTPAARPLPSAPPRGRPVRLRVVHVLEGSQAAASAGRMVISGRMADVCAELERLAAMETAAG